MATEQLADTKTEFDPWSAKSPWEYDTPSFGTPTEEQEPAEAAPEVEVTWVNMTSKPMDWQRHVMKLDISKPAKILGVVMSHYCGPNSHGCSRSLPNLAADSGLSTSAVDRSIKELKREDLVREVGKGMAGNKVYHLGYRDTTSDRG